MIKKWRNKYNNQINGYLFIFPSMFLISIFGIFPILYTFFISLHKWRVRKVDFRGFANYEKIIGEPIFGMIFYFGSAFLQEYTLGVWFNDNARACENLRCFLWKNICKM